MGRGADGFVPGPGYTGPAGTPNSDGPGNPAWQETIRLLAEVQAREQGRS